MRERFCYYERWKRGEDIIGYLIVKFIFHMKHFLCCLYRHRSNFVSRTILFLCIIFVFTAFLSFLFNILIS